MTSRLRLLEVVGTVDPRSGGVVQGILDMAAASEHVAAREVVSLDGADAAFAKSFPIPVFALGQAWGTGRDGSSLGRYGYSSRLRPWLRSNAPSYDAVIVNGLWNYTSLAASMELGRLNVPHFVFIHGMLDPWFSKGRFVKHQIKQLSWLIGEGRLLKSASGVMFTTEEERLRARNLFWGHAGYDEIVVGFGTSDAPKPSTSQFSAFYAALPAVRERKVMLFLSRIHRKKGADILIEAFAKIAPEATDLDLVIAGPDEQGLSERLRARSRELALDGRIHWPGMLTGDAKWGALRSADALVLPSHQENFGVVLAEAMSCGTPVLTTDKVNIWREIAEGGAGLISSDDEAGLVSSLRKWVSLSPVSRACFRSKSRAVFEQKFKMSSAAGKVLDAIQGAKQGTSSSAA